MMIWAPIVALLILVVDLALVMREAVRRSH